MSINLSPEDLSLLQQALTEYVYKLNNDLARAKKSYRATTVKYQEDIQHSNNLIRDFNYIICNTFGGVYEGEIDFSLRSEVRDGNK